MNDQFYETHAQILALRNAIAFIVQTLPEEQKEVVLRALTILSSVKLMQGIELSSASDITEKTADKMNDAYEDIFKVIISLSTQNVEPEQKQYLQ
ncbi:hypothetical protein ACVG87_004325 [Klebsiella aerogenes]